MEQFKFWENLPEYLTVIVFALSAITAFRAYKAKVAEGQKLAELKEAELKVEVFESLARLLNVIENRMGNNALQSDILYTDLKVVKKPIEDKEFKACFENSVWQSSYGRAVQLSAIESVVQLGLQYPFTKPTIRVAFLDFINQDLYAPEIKDGIRRLYEA